MKTTINELIRTAIKSLDALSQHPEILNNPDVESAINLILKLRNCSKHELQ
ncbi:MAG: hypothetical protein ACO3YX_07890 [Candidatus Nanopelagicaceae bacterium]